MLSSAGQDLVREATRILRYVLRRPLRRFEEWHRTVRARPRGHRRR